MSAHTPGPWKAVGTAVLAGTRLVCSTSETELNLGPPTRQAHANARLMAAAYLLPEVVEVLDGIQDVRQCERTRNGDHCEACETALEASTALLSQLRDHGIGDTCDMGAHIEGEHCPACGDTSIGGGS